MKIQSTFLLLTLYYVWARLRTEDLGQGQRICVRDRGSGSRTENLGQEQRIWVKDRGSGSRTEDVGQGQTFLPLTLYCVWVLVSKSCCQARNSEPSLIVIENVVRNAFKQPSYAGFSRVNDFTLYAYWSPSGRICTMQWLHDITFNDKTFEIYKLR